ncbi:MAG: response regulator transcription factor, partial [Muribaculaceae bacterium]|nr:response regulator transcription factor [Muribaculaceae bacterium]
MRTKILVIDDEESVCEILKFNLEREGYEVETAYSAEEALDMDDLETYDLFMVDIMMGELSGFDFANRVRNVTATEHTPILFCSAMSDEDNVVRGLNIGADDYVTKPFNIGEVLARVRAVLRRTGATARRTAADIEQQQSIYETDVTFRDLRIDRNDKECYIGTELVTLTRTEFDILLFFLTHRNKIYSREEIIKNVWGDDVVVTGRTIDTNITRLRKKLGDYDKYIVTRQGFGYG